MRCEPILLFTYQSVQERLFPMKWLWFLSREIPVASRNIGWNRQLNIRTVQYKYVIRLIYHCGARQMEKQFISSPYLPRLQSNFWLISSSTFVVSRKTRCSCIFLYFLSIMTKMNRRNKSHSQKSKCFYLTDYV